MKRPYISGPDCHGLQRGARVVINGTAWKAIKVESITPPVVSLRRWRWYDDVLALRPSPAFWAGFMDGLAWGPVWRGIARVVAAVRQRNSTRA